MGASAWLRSMRSGVRAEAWPYWAAAAASRFCETKISSAPEESASTSQMTGWPAELSVRRTPCRANRAGLEAESYCCRAGSPEHGERRSRTTRRRSAVWACRQQDSVRLPVDGGARAGRSAQTPWRDTSCRTGRAGGSGAFGAGNLLQDQGREGERQVVGPGLRRFEEISLSELVGRALINLRARQGGAPQFDLEVDARPRRRSREQMPGLPSSSLLISRSRFGGTSRRRPPGLGGAASAAGPVRESPWRD